MMVIWKYTLLVTDLQTVRMPKNAQILSLKTQHDYPQLWVLCDPYEEYENRTFITIGTGNNFYYDLDKLKFIDSFLIKEDMYVSHVFELVK